MRTVTQSIAPTSTTTLYVHDQDDHIIAELNASGQTLKEYLWLGDMPLAVVDGSGGTPTLYWVHVDHLMRPIRMSDANAATVWSAVYAPFGATTSVTANPEVMNARFPGQWFQLETGLAYNWHRHYDATIGRYVQPDPKGLTAMLNDGSSIYVYVKSKPFVMVDLEGLATTIVITYDHNVGSRAALYTSNGTDCGPALYDTAESYFGNNRGSGDLFQCGDANLQAYLRYQRLTGSDVDTYKYNTSPEDEKRINNKADQLGGAFPGLCADHVSEAISGIGPFKDLKHYYLPGYLANALRKIPGSTLDHIK